MRACVCDVFAIYDNNISPSPMIIIKIIILYFIQFQIRHTDNFPPTGTPASITNMWHDHFKGLLNCVDNITHRKYVLDSIGNMPTQYDWFTPVEIMSAIEGLNGSKASGTDNVFAEHLKYAGAKIHVLLSLCFNACMVHGFLPSTMTDTILVPIIKDKTGNASSKANYRLTALTSVLSKVFETAHLSKLKSVFETSDYQFGFKSHHSTDLCIYTLKEIVKYYKSHSTSVYIKGCFQGFRYGKPLDVI